jgi:hypothetical protein
LPQDQEDDADYQHDNADCHQNADAQDPAQDQQDETKNNHVILLNLYVPPNRRLHTPAVPSGDEIEVTAAWGIRDTAVIM